MSSIIIRYCSPKYSNNLYNDYVESGLGLNKLQLDESKSKNEIRTLLSNLNSISMNSINDIYFAKSKVSRETALLIAQELNIKKVSVSSTLNNVLHDFTRLTSEKYWKNGRNPSKEQFFKLRKKFLEDFLDDKLLEPKSKTLNRIEKLVELIKTKNVIMITHGIMIKLIEIRLGIGFDQSKKEIINFANIQEPFFGALKGLTISNELEFKYI